MNKSDLFKKIAQRETKAEDIATQAIKDQKLIPIIIEGFGSEVTEVKFKSAKILVMISKDKPELLYPYFDFFAKNLDNENNILKWNAMDVVANLTQVDSEKKFDKLFEKFIGLMDEGKLVTAGHVVSNAPVIAKTKPKLEEKITSKILSLEEISLPTSECRNILKGHAINAFETYYEQIKNKKDVIGFVRNELKNSRNSTAKKAERFLKKNKINL